MEPSRDVIIVSGKDVVVEVGGHASYVRAMGRAALAAGFHPHIFSASRKGGVEETEFGTIHWVKSPLRFVTRHGAGQGFRNRFLPFHAGPITRRIVAFLEGRDGAFIVHGVGPWGSLAPRVRDLMDSPTRRIVPIVTMWSTMQHEHSAKIAGLSRRLGFAAWVRGHFEWWWFRFFIFPKDRIGYTRSDLVLVNYEAVADQVRQAAPGEHPPILVVPYATEKAFLDPIAPYPVPAEIAALQPADAPLIVAVSRHDSRKGLDLLLEALGRLRDEGVAFRACIVGPGPLLGVHRSLAADLDLGSTTAIIGYAEDQMAYLQHADVFVLPSLEEGSGSLSLLEALQAGAAVVASDVDGIPEDVPHGESAELVAVGDVDAWVRALRRVLTDEVLRRRLQSAARQAFEERFSAENFTRSVQDLYRRLLSEAVGDE